MLKPRCGRFAGRPAAAAYEKSIFTAILVAKESHTETATQAILTLLSSTLASVVSHTYANLLALDISSGRVGRFKEIKSLPWNHIPLLVGINGPTIIFVASYLGLLSIGHAFLLAKISALIMLFIYGFIMGKMTGKHMWGRLGAGAVTCAIGVMVLAVKVVSH